MDKRVFNRHGVIVITEDWNGTLRYRGYPIPEKDGSYDLLRERLLTKTNLSYLEGKGITVREQYDTAEEIQDIIDLFDPAHFVPEYIREIGDTGDMYVTGMYEYLGETDEYFVHGKSYYCPQDSEYSFLLIGEDLKDYDCDKSLFREVIRYNCLEPAIYSMLSKKI